jgi:hypothetical protein
VSRSGTQFNGALTSGARLVGLSMILKHKTSETLFNYWDAVRGSRTTPRRFEIEPGKIAAILPSTFILERLDAETFRFRLAGTRVCEIFGAELRGTNFLSGWATADRMSLVRHLAAVVKQGAVETIHMEAAPVARPSTPFEMLLLPLRHTGETIDRILGSVSPLDPPHWLGELPLTAKRIIAHELTWPSGDAPKREDERTLGETPVLLPGRHSRIVRSDRRQFRVFEGGLARGGHDKPQS